MSLPTPQAWFSQQVKTLQAVRTCLPTTDGNADLLIRTWMGMTVKVYFLQGVPNLRAIKRELQENTRTYQATLLVALHSLFPPDRQRLIPDEWMSALHELNSERIYTFRPDHAGLGQIHFDYLADGVEREAWYGGEVEFTALRVLNITANQRAVRGSYMIADLGANPYWTNRGFRAERLNERYWQARNRADNFVWDRYDMGGNPGGVDSDSLRRAHKSQLQISYELLGLPLDAPQDEVKAAFRRLAREYHPDVSALDEGEANTRFQALSAAYEYIKSKKQWS